MKILLLLLPLLFDFQNLPAQKMLLLEKTTKVKPQKFFIGETLTYKLDEHQATWFSDEILDILPEENALVLGIQKVRIEDIAALRFHRPLIDGLGRKTGVFGAQLIFFSTLGLVAFDDLNAKKGLAIGGGAIGASFLTIKLLKFKRVKMGHRHRLRTIEIPVFLKGQIRN